MQWIELHIANIRAAVEEIDEVLRALGTLEKQREKLNSDIDAVGDPNRVNKTISKKTEIECMRKKKQVDKMDSAVYTIVEAMKTRSVELKEFYDGHDLDPRVAPLEPARLAIKRALLERGQSVPAPRAPSGNPRSNSSVSSINHHIGTGVNYQKRGSNISVATAAPASKGPAGRTPDSILLKVILTEEEFKEVQRRRQAMQALVGESRR